MLNRILFQREKPSPAQYIRLAPYNDYNIQSPYRQKRSELMIILFSNRPLSVMIINSQVQRVMPFYYKARVGKRDQNWWSKWNLQISKNALILSSYVHIYTRGNMNTKSCTRSELMQLRGTKEISFLTWNKSMKAALQ